MLNKKNRIKDYTPLTREDLRQLKKEIKILKGDSLVELLLIRNELRKSTIDKNKIISSIVVLEEMLT